MVSTVRRSILYRVCALTGILLLLLGAATGCSGGNTSATATPQATGTQEPGTETPSGPTDATQTPTSAASPTEAPDLSNHVAWAVPFFSAPTEEGRAEINRLLKEKGIDCVIDFVNVDAMTDQEYEAWLAKMEKNGQVPDILNTGNWYTQHGAGLMAEAYFLQLDDYLATAEGAELSKAYSEFEWVRSRIGGKTYVAPRMFSPESCDKGVYLRVKDEDAARFGAWDGTYEELLRICGEANGVAAIPYLRWTMVSALAGYASYDGIPYDPATGEVVLWTKSEKLVSLWNTMFEDIKAGRLIDLSVSDSALTKSGTREQAGTSDSSAGTGIVAEIYFGLREQKQGYTDICIIADSGEPLLNGTYGVYRDSLKTELALRAFAACMADPQIVALFNPRFETAEAVTRCHAILAERTPGITAGLLPDLTVAQWTAYKELKKGMYAVENACYTADLNGQYHAETFDAGELTKSFAADKYKNLTGRLSEQLQALVGEGNE